MKRTVNRMLLVAVGLLPARHGRPVAAQRLPQEERNRYRSNTEALLSGHEAHTHRLDNARRGCETHCGCGSTSISACGLRMPRKIRRLGVKVKNLEAAARHEIEITGPIDAVVRDTVVIRDTVPILRQKVEMITPHIQLAGLIENGRLKGEIRVPVTLRQAVWVEYKGWWFWRRVKAIHQTIAGG